jgi:tetratricopeptide (TPR) repeat protein
VECALAIQKVTAEREQKVSPERRFALRIGIHSGDIIVDAENDLCGDAVNIAARLEKLAEPGGICLSDHAYEEMAGRVDATFAYGGEPPLKNIGRGVGVWFWPPGDHGQRALDPSAASSPAARNAWSNPRPSARWPEIFGNVPPRDLNFLGREEALSRLHRLLTRAERPTGVTQVAIHGLGGIGKTTLAAEYAHRHAGEYAGVWWVSAETRPGLLASLVDLAGRLDARLAEDPDQEKAAQAGLAHLARSGVPYLLVYDNVETPEVLSGLLPRAGARVILTTRWADWSGRAEELELPLLDPDAAADLLRTRGGRPDDPGAARLAETVGCLPLALDHAGAYCRLTGMSFDAYCGRLDQVIARTPKGVTYPASIGATFGLAIEKAAAECPATERLLGLCAYLAPERIPLDLIADDIADEGERADALMTLTAVSLVEHVELENGEPAITVHRLVQAAMRARVAERGQTEAAVERVTHSLAETFPKTAYTDTRVWPRCAELLPHVLALRECLPASSGSQGAAELYYATGSYLLGRSAYAEAEPFFNEALAMMEKTLGREHLAVATLIHRLAILHRLSGRYAEAEPLFEEALAIKETMLGRDHHEVALVLTNLAYLYHDTDRHAEAEPLHKEAIAIGEKALGRGHHLVGMYLNNLAHLYHDIGRHAEAEPLYKEAIAIGEKSLGREHSYTAIWLTGLARLYRDTDRHAEAEPLFAEAIALGERTLGREHRVTARARQYLASLLLASGRGEEALSQGNAALEVCDRLLGASHQRTTETARICAAALTSLGRGAEASALLARYGLPLAGGN